MQTEYLDGIIALDRGSRKPPDCFNLCRLPHRVCENGSAHASRLDGKCKLHFATRYNSGTLAQEVKVSRDIIHGLKNRHVASCHTACSVVNLCSSRRVNERLLREDISQFFRGTSLARYSFYCTCNLCMFNIYFTNIFFRRNNFPKIISKFFS